MHVQVSFFSLFSLSQDKENSVRCLDGMMCTAIVSLLPVLEAAVIGVNYMLCVCLCVCVHMTGLGLTNNGDTKKTRSYTVVATNSDNVHYKPLPLKDFASIEMSASSGASVTTDVTPIFPCCRGLCICCGVRRNSRLACCMAMLYCIVLHSLYGVRQSYMCKRIAFVDFGV